MKKILIITIAALLCLGIVLTGCAASTAETAAATSSEGSSNPAFVGSAEETYYFVTFAGGVDYWSSLYEGFKDAGRQLGVNTAYAGTNEADINEEVALFNDVLATNPAGIYLCPFTGEPFADSLKAAKEQGVPVCLYTNPPEDSSLYLAMIDHDNTRDSSVAAEYFAQELGGKGKILMETTEGQNNHIQRAEAFKTYMTENYPDIEIVLETPTNHDSELGAQAVKDALIAYPDLAGVFCVATNCALGASTAIQESGKDIKLLTFDTDPGVIDMIKSGQITAAMQPDAYMFGYDGLLFTYIEKHGLMDPMTDQAANGEYLFGGQVVYPSCRPVTAANADYYLSTSYLERRGSKGYDESGLAMTNESLPGLWTR